MDFNARTYAVNMVLAWVPDVVVAWAAMRLTDNEVSSFWIALIALQAVYFFFWLKQAVWSWLLFWIIGKKQMARSLENYFIDSNFPPPDEYTDDLDMYFSDMANNEDLDPPTRVKAAYEHGSLNGLRLARRYSLALQLSIASGVALKRYAKLAARFRHAT